MYLNRKEIIVLEDTDNGCEVTLSNKRKIVVADTAIEIAEKITDAQNREEQMIYVAES